MVFIDHFTHLYEIERHQLSYMQLYNTQDAYYSHLYTFVKKLTAMGASNGLQTGGPTKV